MKHLRSAMCVASTFVIFACSNATANPIDIPLPLVQSQITDHTFTNDTWYSGLLPLGGNVVLGPNESKTINITFGKGQFVKINDGSIFNGSESIRFVVKGTAPPRGAPDNTADFEFLFTGVKGDLLKNPVTGTVTYGASTGNVDFHKSIDLINGGILEFHDLHLTLKNKNTNPWAFDEIGVGVDGDDVTIGVPEPSSLTMLGTGLLLVLGLGCYARRRAMGQGLHRGSAGC